jgi:leader peptidase (prepilin peptidase) / N-methyltransferase
MPLLRRSLPGEYLSLALMMHAGLGAMIWAVYVYQDPVRLVIVAAGIWIASRAAGSLSAWSFAPILTAGLLVGVLVSERESADVPAGLLVIFSPLVFGAMLALVLILDLCEWVRSPFGARSANWLLRLNWHRLAVWGFVLVFATYMVVVPTVGWIVERMQPPSSGHELKELSLADQVRLRSMVALTALWFLVLGATIGSFLNVVAYRMPRGESVVLQRSRCPACGTQIRGRDNVPIFGWLLLGGRCRACQASISTRYPLVEAVAGGLFLLLYFVELISGGDNIPERQPNHYRGVVWIIFYTKWDLIGLYLYHCFLLSALLTWTLIDIDRQRVTARAQWIVASVLIISPMIWPGLLPVGLHGEAAAWLGSPWLAAGFSSLVGGIVGAVLGHLAQWAIRPRHGGPWDSSFSSHFASGSTLVGLGLGWQAAIAVILLALLLRPGVVLLARLLRRPAVPPTAILLAACVVNLVWWRWSVQQLSPWWPGPATSLFGWLLIAASVGGLLLCNRPLRAEAAWESPPEESSADSAPAPAGS